MCVGNYEIKNPTYKNFIENNKWLHTNGRLELHQNSLQPFQICTLVKTNASPLCILYMDAKLMPQIISLPTLTLVCK
jgi:hypothetical protein